MCKKSAQRFCGKKSGCFEKPLAQRVRGRRRATIKSSPTDAIIGLREKGFEAPVYFRASVPIYFVVVRSPSFGVPPGYRRRERPASKNGTLYGVDRRHS
jgi:hypothetical protein